ncbi:hypothetical protein KP509_23G041200 [Ceratopteris richardii]|uniref:Uncharacterized protein n=1 Tax=Ceratopteris richardii TaxID=49495 RepID=A0A8T2S0W3_CERRI|nr:hypothetical protein KP509_23G041200 [Ceratopteris richardii]
MGLQRSLFELLMEESMRRRSWSQEDVPVRVAESSLQKVKGMNKHGELDECPGARRPLIRNQKECSDIIEQALAAQTTAASFSNGSNQREPREFTVENSLRRKELSKDTDDLLNMKELSINRINRLNDDGGTERHLRGTNPCIRDQNEELIIAQEAAVTTGVNLPNVNHEGEPAIAHHNQPFLLESASLLGPQKQKYLFLDMDGQGQRLAMPCLEDESYTFLEVASAVDTVHMALAKAHRNRKQILARAAKLRAAMDAFRTKTQQQNNSTLISKPFSTLDQPHC